MLNPSAAILRSRRFPDLLARIMGSAEPSRRLVTLLGWAVVVAVAMSTEFLFQPFIWRNFSLADILPGWLTIARDRAVVASMIALLLALVERRTWKGRWRFLPYIVAVVVGAATGEALLSWVTPQEDRQDILSLMGRILRWSIVGGAIAIMVQVWRSGAELAAAAEESRIEEAQARRLAASSQLEMLRRQIEPHFLFNVLATIRRLHETDPQQGQYVLGRLFHYMSATLTETPEQRSSLGDEIDLVRAYLDVCVSRMTGRLHVVIEAPASLNGLSFPPLALATLAENAIKHGVFPQNGGVVTLSARIEGGMLEVTLSDDGAGLTGEGGGGGMGLANVVERLRLLYGPTASLNLGANIPRGVRAVIRIPAWPA